MVYEMKLLASILKESLQRFASDVILSPWSIPSLKKNWEIVYLEQYEVLEHNEFKILVLGIMQKSQQEKFLENMELDFTISLWNTRFRTNAFITKDWYWLVFRPIASVIPDFESLGLPSFLKSFTEKRNGIVLITWSVWSGKSTTMAALIDLINQTSKKHIITIEDPIEYVYENKQSLFEQREVWSSTLSFENWLKYALRQAPDVIMVWEMRDLETFRLALRAAETGNLVFATLHTSWAARTVSRIIDMFPWNERDQIRTQISTSLLGVIWQKLVKTNTWRIAAIEVLVNNVWVSNIIRKGDIHQLDWMIETSFQDGMITMKKSLDILLEKWIITKEVYEDELKNNR